MFINLFYSTGALLSEVVFYKSFLQTLIYLIIRVSTLNINNLTFQLDGHIIKKLKTQQTQQFYLTLNHIKTPNLTYFKQVKRNYIL